MAPPSVTRAPRRGRPPAHSRDEVVDAALAEGLRDLTVAGVAGRMGIPTATVYSYVADRDDLARAVAERLLEDAVVPTDSRVGADEVAVGAGMSLFGVALGHPGLAEFYLSHAWASLLRFEESFAAALHARGLDEVEAVLVTDAVVALTMGEVMHLQSDEAGPSEDSFGVDRPTHLAGGDVVGELPADVRFRWTLQSLVRGTLEMLREGRRPDA